MEIFIDDDMTLGDLKTIFNNRFPHLKLEFYAREHQSGQGSPKADLLENHLKIGQVRSVQTEGHLSIHGNQKTKTLETRFREVYGLNAQVFRKSGNVWLQTTKTDEWTLAEQEQQSKNMQAALSERNPEDTRFDMD